MSDMRDRIRILGALLALPLLTLDSGPAAAGTTTKKKAVRKKATKKKATKKKATKKKATKKKATKKKATKKKATKKKATKKSSNSVTKVPEPGTVGLVGAGLLAAGVASKFRRAKKKPR